MPSKDSAQVDFFLGGGVEGFVVFLGGFVEEAWLFCMSHLPVRKRVAEEKRKNRQN